jgi:hypothetical protein
MRASIGFRLLAGTLETRTPFLARLTLLRT